MSHVSGTQLYSKTLLFYYILICVFFSPARYVPWRMDCALIIFVSVVLAIKEVIRTVEWICPRKYFTTLIQKKKIHKILKCLKSAACTVVSKFVMLFCTIASEMKKKLSEGKFIMTFAECYSLNKKSFSDSEKGRIWTC